MAYRFHRSIEQHSGTGEPHNLPHPFAHGRLITMYGTLLARAFFLSERTMVKAGMCVAEQLFALRTKSCILLFLPAIETDHDLYGSLFLSDTRFFICFHLFSFRFGGWLHFGKDNKLIAYSAKNFHWNDCRCWKLCVSLRHEKVIMSAMQDCCPICGE